MTHNEIEKALNDRHFSWRSAAAVIGKSATAVIRVSKRDLDSRAIAMALSTLIDDDVTNVFPDKPNYHSDSPKEARKKVIALGKKKLQEAGLVAGWS